MKNSITYLKGNIFSSPAEVIVNPVNTFGVMGKGLAADFKKKYPAMFKRYKYFCDEKKFSVGQLWIFEDAVDYRILLFPTKKHWRGKSKIEYIDEGLKKFVSIYEQKKIDSIAFPKLGCGYGGLSWGEVQPLMEKYLSELPIKIYIYLDNIEENITHSKKLYPIPDIIKTEDFFFADDGKLINLNLNLILEAGYLSNVLIQNDDNFIEGFQVNGGMIRRLKTQQTQTELF